MKLSENSFLTETPDGRKWRIEVFGSGRIKATDIMSPTGYHEWISAEQAGVKFINQKAKT
jgi:hypothetical protein